VAVTGVTTMNAPAIPCLYGVTDWYIAGDVRSDTKVFATDMPSIRRRLTLAAFYLTLF